MWGGGGNRNGSGYTHGPQNICMSSDPDDHNLTRIDQSRPASKVSIYNVILQHPITDMFVERVNAVTNQMCLS